MNFEVVLADGGIVNANKDEHSDLWKSLKGGSGNVGLITRIDQRKSSLKTVNPNSNTVVLQVLSARTKSGQVLSALTFLNATLSSKNISTLWSPTTRILLLSSSLLSNGMENKSSYSQLFRIPTPWKLHLPSRNFSASPVLPIQQRKARSPMSCLSSPGLLPSVFSKSTHPNVCLGN